MKLEWTRSLAAATVAAVATATVPASRLQAHTLLWQSTSIIHISNVEAHRRRDPDIPEDDILII